MSQTRSTQKVLQHDYDKKNASNANGSLFFTIVSTAFIQYFELNGLEFRTLDVKKQAGCAAAMYALNLLVCIPCFVRGYINFPFLYLFSCLYEIHLSDNFERIISTIKQYFDLIAAIYASF